MEKINVLIVDDETPARELIKYYLQDYTDLHVVGEANNGFDAMKLVKELCPQLIFLDVQMPRLTGFEMLELMENPPEIIFSTAYDQYAIRAFEMNALDYLLKPYAKDRFGVAVQKAITKITTGTTTAAESQQKLAASIEKPQETLGRIAVKNRQQIHIIPVDQIDYIEADGDYVQLHTTEGIFLKEKTMKYFENNLSPQQFVRIHRSFIVNVDKVAKIEIYEKESYHVHLRNNALLKASSNGYKLLKSVVKL